MKNILIILCMTLAIGFASMFITEAVLKNADQKKESEQVTTKETETTVKTALDEFARSSQELSDQMRISNENDKKSLMAGVIGAGLGFICGLGIVMAKDRKKVKN